MIHDLDTVLHQGLSYVRSVRLDTEGWREDAKMQSRFWQVWWHRACEGEDPWPRVRTLCSKLYQAERHKEKRDLWCRCETGGKEKCDSDGCEERFTFVTQLYMSTYVSYDSIQSLRTKAFVTHAVQTARSATVPSLRALKMEFRPGVGAGGCDPNKCDAGYGPRRSSGFQTIGGLHCS